MVQGLSGGRSSVAAIGAGEISADLCSPSARISARRVKEGASLARQPGLYAWWVDSTGARELEKGLGHRVTPGLIYAGQAGATRWPSGKPSPATLASRIGQGHLGHSIDGSTFRLTLAAALQARLALEMRSAKYLTNEGEQSLTSWMLQHLAVSVHPVADGDALAALEEAVLQQLNPPLNLDGMPRTPLRERLSILRTQLRRSGGIAKPSVRRIGLVGCVKSKRDVVAPAGNLYLSALFQGRRRAVERNCDAWFVLSAKHGLLAPGKRIAPYDVTLTTASADQRRRWAQRVLRQVDDVIGSVSGTTFEIHAGSAYADCGLVDGLRDRGARVVQPAQGLGLGQQLAFYRAFRQ